MEAHHSVLFTDSFLVTLKSLIALHHSIYPRIPPQGIFFESLVEQAFRRSGWPAPQVILSKANTPQHDLLVGTARISLKTETGTGTHPSLISITKLRTTETGAWDSAALIEHTMQHLSRYDHMLMLRAIWRPAVIHYQVLEIPLVILRLIEGITVVGVGRRTGRKSMAADVYDQGTKLFHLHFDGADGKCQVQRLLVNRCWLLAEWEQPFMV